MLPDLAFATVINVNLNLISDLPRAMGRILKNKLFVLLTIALAIEVNVHGFFTFLPKYFQQHYGLTASVASVITGKNRLND